MGRHHRRSHYNVRVSTTRSHHKRHNRKRYNPFSTKTIRLHRLTIDVLKFIAAAVILYAVFSTLQLNYFRDRSSILESGVDNFYSEDNVSLIKSNSKLESKMSDIVEVYQLALAKYLDIKDENDELNDKLLSIANDIVVLDKQNVSLVESNNEYYEKLMDYQEREELFDNYEYALFYNGKRTDITYDDLRTGIDVMESNGIDPDLLFAIVMVESHGAEKARNPASTATGYAQLLHGTGRSVYENYMKNGKNSFSTDMLLEGDQNLTIAANYLKLLLDDSSNVSDALVKYRGTPDDGVWMSAVNSYMKKGGTSLAQVDKEYYGRN